MAGQSLLAFSWDDEHAAPASTCLACVQPSDEQPKRRLFALLQSPGRQRNQQSEFLSDGGATVRDRQLSLRPEAEHRLDGIHITLRLTTLTPTAKSFPEKTEAEAARPLRGAVVRALDRSKRLLWHGTVFQALPGRRLVEGALESAVWESNDPAAQKLSKAVQEFSTYIERQSGCSPNDGERYRNGERGSTGVVASTAHYVVSTQMMKKQQMRWSQRGAHWLLQIRTRGLHGAWEATFRQWYPGCRTYTTPAVACGCPPRPDVAASPLCGLVSTAIRPYDTPPPSPISRCGKRFQWC